MRHESPKYSRENKSRVPKRISGAPKTGRIGGPGRSSADESSSGVDELGESGGRLGNSAGKLGECSNGASTCGEQQGGGERAEERYEVGWHV